MPAIFPTALLSLKPRSVRAYHGLPSYSFSSYPSSRTVGPSFSVSSLSVRVFSVSSRFAHECPSCPRTCVIPLQACWTPLQIRLSGRSAVAPLTTCIISLVSTHMRDTPRRGCRRQRFADECATVPCSPPAYTRLMGACLPPRATLPALLATVPLLTAPLGTPFSWASQACGQRHRHRVASPPKTPFPILGLRTWEPLNEGSPSTQTYAHGTHLESTGALKVDYGS